MTKKFKLAIAMENDAMLTASDVAKALHDVANALDRQAGVRGGIRDINGNIVGYWTFVRGKE